MEVVNPVIKRWRHQAEADFEGFWARAAEAVPWFRKWDTVFESTPPTFRWFSGALTNLSHNCLDHHVGRGWGGHAALITENERGEQRVLTYAQMLGAVEAVAAGLRRIGVRRGDRVAIYMPTCAEAIMAMLATCRIGAIHLVVFAGFGSEALAERIRLAGARTLLAADVTWRKGNEVNLWDIARRALADPATPVEKAVVLVRGRTRPALDPMRDLEWPAFLAEGPEAETRCEVMEANDPAFILATSGTTAKPKLAVHNHGPYQVGIASAGKWLFDLTPADVWWSTSDIGWIVGHSYIVYAPLLAGCTTIAYEGALDHPGPERFYGIVARNRVTGIFTSPTAARALMRHGSAPARRFNLHALERVVCAGEVLNAPVWEWLQKEVLEDRVPVIDHWWQTETGGPVIGNPYGIGLLPIKPGSAGMPLPGYAAEVRALDGSPCPPREKGIVVLTRPFPGLTQTLWGDPDRYARDYWRQIPGAYFTGDAAYVDEDGYFWFSGRADEIIRRDRPARSAARGGDLRVRGAQGGLPAVRRAQTRAAGNGPARFRPRGGDRRPAFRRHAPQDPQRQDGSFRCFPAPPRSSAHSGSPTCSSVCRTTATSPLKSRASPCSARRSSARPCPAGRSRTGSAARSTKARASTTWTTGRSPGSTPT